MGINELHLISLFVQPQPLKIVSLCSSGLPSNECPHKHFFGKLVDFIVGLKRKVLT